MHSSGDTEAYSVSVGELVWVLLCTLLVIQTVACPISASELACFLLCSLLVTHVGVSFLGGELTWFLMWTLLVTDILAIFF